MRNKAVSLIDMIKLSHNIELSKPYIQYLCGLDKARAYRHQEILDIQSLLAAVTLPTESVSGFLIWICCTAAKSRIRFVKNFAKCLFKYRTEE